MRKVPRMKILFCKKEYMCVSVLCPGWQALQDGRELTSVPALGQHENSDCMRAVQPKSHVPVGLSPGMVAVTDLLFVRRLLTLPASCRHGDGIDSKGTKLGEA